ncbi:hypothetical protein L202_02909 [Cryptococcus amylolentus CBS 6039]|uniref:DUF1772 domain-containing protein n=1 Tax=Cryptococcus amylolentus CBS 6039 TaxID=1295533 RepID=A0A1E3HWS9_9TREE|nr:hypothetical protein L202_02909 [Cryptococcus amylolentus CBS 6039]ODN80754.1 hypothetical protein L202_02909 [Cryptococcus amylolentus CBS 6039]
MSSSSSTSLIALPPASITLAFGGLTTAYVFFSGLADETWGTVPLLNGRLGSIPIDDKTRVKAWNAYYDRAHVGFIGASVASMVLNFTSSYIHPSPIISKLALISGITSILVVPATFALGLMPINKRLFALNDGAEPVKDGEGKELVQRWESKHYWRFPIYAGAWVFSWAAIVYDGRA